MGRPSQHTSCLTRQPVWEQDNINSGYRWTLLRERKDCKVLHRSSAHWAANNPHSYHCIKNSEATWTFEKPHCAFMIVNHGDVLSVLSVHNTNLTQPKTTHWHLKPPQRPVWPLHVSVRHCLMNWFCDCSSSKVFSIIVTRSEWNIPPLHAYRYDRCCIWDCSIYSCILLSYSLITQFTEKCEQAHGQTNISTDKGSEHLIES